MNAEHKDREATLLAIAKDVLGIETLETRNSDRLDFHDLSVATIRKALRNAYVAGRASGIRACEPKRSDACPRCGEPDHDNLVWVESDMVQCQRCLTKYDPRDGYVYEATTRKGGSHDQPR